MSLPAPNSCFRVILEDRLNLAVSTSKKKSFLSTSQLKERVASRKRTAKRHSQENKQKRAKTCEAVLENEEDETEEEDSALFEDSDEDEPVVPCPPARRRTAFHAHSAFASTSAHTYQRLNVTTRPILESFVSSLKADVYRCQSINANSFLTPPYACAYSHSAKSGGSPLLAVATEEGTLQIINTSKRKPWDPEPARQVLQSHTNGVFDVKWDTTDTRIVTCSGDHSSRITCVERNITTHVLHGHTSTVKAAAWDPANDALLATSGRDGVISLWDLRINSTKSDDSYVLEPVLVIPGAHEDPTKLKIRKSKKNIPMPKTVTSLIYPDGEPYGLISSGAFDGILRFWDLRKAETPRKARSTKPKPPPVLYSTPADPTTFHGSKRPRGIISLAKGSGPTAGLVFGLGQDSRIHTYTLPSLTSQVVAYVDDALQSTSFYAGLALSPCGNWLACGASSPKSSSFLFEVSEAGRSRRPVETERAIELPGTAGEIGAVDWADGSLATCADDGTVHVWRPDVEVYRQCQEKPDEAKWDWSWSKQVVR